MKKTVISICLLALAAANLFSQQGEFPKLAGPYLGQESLLRFPEKQNIIKRLDSQFEPFLDDYIKENRIPGIGIGIVGLGEIVYAKTFGVKNLETKESLSVHSLFHQASVTKVFVGTAIMQLVEQGKINLNDKIIQHLPYFRLDDIRYKEITISQMVSHTSGMPDVLDYQWDNPSFDEGALERNTKSLVDKKLIADPGELYRYSNMAFDVLGDLIAKVSGMTFEDYIRINIFELLKMNNTTLNKQEAKTDLLTSPHVFDDSIGGPKVSSIFPYNRMHTPSSTLISNIEDMCRWLQANLNKGEFEGKRILKTSSYDVLWKVANESSRQVGISWFIGRLNKHRTIYHTGADVGYHSYLLLIPEKKLGVIVCSNYEAPISPIGKRALLCALGEEEEVAPPPVYINLETKDMIRFEGTYELRKGKHFHVFLKEGKLYFQQEGRDEYELMPVLNHEFIAKEVNTRVSFENNKKTQREYIVLHTGGLELPYRKMTANEKKDKQ